MNTQTTNCVAAIECATQRKFVTDTVADWCKKDAAAELTAKISDGNVLVCKSFSGASMCLAGETKATSC
jgi:hypothetical protein